jgi:hypothetical protein
LSFDYAGESNKLLLQLEALQKEVNAFYAGVDPDNAPGLNHCPNSVNAYFMFCFSKIDLLASYLFGYLSTRGKKPEENQTWRMVEFIVNYGMTTDRDAANVAVQLWRHKLMHTSEPRMIEDSKTAVRYIWHSQWTEKQMPRSEHFRFQNGSVSPRILNLCLTCLIDDLRNAGAAYRKDLLNPASTQLQSNFQTAHSQLTQAQRFLMQ